MKKVTYYQDANDRLYTEREVKLMLLDKKTLKKRLLGRDEICGKTVRFPKSLFDYGETIGELSTKDLRKAKVRRDLMRLGIEW